MCGTWNFHFVTANKSNTAVADKCSICGQLKKEARKTGYNKHPVSKPSFAAAAIEKFIAEHITSGVQKVLDAQRTSDGSVMAG